MNKLQHYSDDTLAFLQLGRNSMDELNTFEFKDTSGATKHDADKPDMDLILPEFEMGLATVLTFGAKKYGRLNYQKGMNKDRLLSAIMRHLNEYRSGQITDSESGLSHLYHMTASLMFLDFYDRKGINNDS